MVNKTKVYPLQDINVDADLGAVEIKDADSDQRATVNSEGALRVSPLNTLINFFFDKVEKVVVDTVTDRFDYTLSTIVVGQIEVTYTNVCKDEFLSAERL